MNELLSSMKEDLLSRRMLPLLVIAGVALLGALGYVALASVSGGSKASPGTSSVVKPVAPLPGPAVASAPANPNAALSETTLGAGYQHRGKMRNPFTPLPGSGSTEGGGSGSASSGSSSAAGGSGGSGSGESSGGASGGGSGESSGGSGSSGSGGGSNGSGGSSGSGSGAPQPSTPLNLYRVDVQLQQLSEAGTPIGAPQTFKGVAKLQPLPSKRRPLVAPMGVTGHGAGVLFLLLREAILHGKATCAPSAANCEAIDVRLHQGEELQVFENDGSVRWYRLTVTKIEKVSGGASASAARVSAAGSAVIARMHLSVPSSARFAGPLGAIAGAPASVKGHASRRSGDAGR
jgi:hypothetical protein